MSQQCHVCGPVKHEAPTVMCAPCALQDWRAERARSYLESLIPLADAVMGLDVMNDLVFRPFTYTEFRFK